MSDTPETDEALANSECEDDLVISMRSMERRMNDAIQEATNAVNDILRVEWERDELRAAIQNLRDVQGRHHAEIATKRLFDLIHPSKI